MYNCDRFFKKKWGLKKKTTVALGLLFTYFSLISCGRDTSNWPRMTLPFSVSEIEKIIINFHDPYLEETDRISIEDERIGDIHHKIINYPYREKIEKAIETKNYHCKVGLDFVLDNEEHQTYRMTYYEYGIKNGKIMFDNGEVHFVSGNFSWLYYDYRVIV